jgi:HD-like signal output (HDOD) protein
MSLLSKLGQISELPTLPEVLLRVQSVISSDGSDSRALAKIVGEDPALAAKILQVANSAYFATDKHISSIEKAIVRIGFNQVGSIVMAVGVINHLARSGHFLSYHGFWLHSLTAAYLAQWLLDQSSVRFEPQDRERIFIAGLFHDLGILVYDQFFTADFKALCDSALSQEVSYLVAEQQSAPREGHAFLGSALLELWKMDSALCNCVRFHHHWERAPQHVQSLVALISISEYVLCNGRIGAFEGSYEPLASLVWQSAGIDPLVLPRLVAIAEAEEEKCALILSSQSGGSECLGTLRYI